MKQLLLILPVTLALAGTGVTPADADEVILDDLIVNGGSACVGTNCVDGMAFGFNTLVLDQTDPSILFRDTSISAAFPTTDWRFGTTTATGDFAITNVSSGQTVFAVSGDGTAVGIGAGATLTSGAVSVGGMRVSNAADGVALTDAVTLGQLNAAIATLPAGLLATNTQLAATNAANAVQLTRLGNEIDAVGAIGSAMSALQVNPRGTGNHFFSFGMGFYEGTSAIAAGSFHFLANDSIFVNTGISGATNGVGGTAGRVGVTFGR